MEIFFLFLFWFVTGWIMILLISYFDYQNDIPEILFKVALNTNPPPPLIIIYTFVAISYLKPLFR